jgi:hypothetical protein
MARLREEDERVNISMDVCDKQPMLSALPARTARLSEIQKTWLSGANLTTHFCD